MEIVGIIVGIFLLFCALAGIAACIVSGRISQWEREQYGEDYC